MKKNEKLRKMTYTALFAALTCVLAQIVLPLPFTPVPVSLGTVIPVLSGMLGGVGIGALSQVIYLFVGAIGLPVFAGMKGGLSVLAGPTGGFLVGFIISSAVSGAILKKCENRSWGAVLSAAAGMAVCYIPGLAWFMLQTQSNIYSACTMCLLPFIPGDILKTILCIFTYKAFKKRNVKL